MANNKTKRLNRKFIFAVALPIAVPGSLDIDLQHAGANVNSHTSAAGCGRLPISPSLRMTANSG
jgi:hypothetical protein